MRLRTLRFLLSLAPVACSESGPIAPGPLEEPLVQLPAPIGEANFGSHREATQPSLFWRADGTAVVYQSIIGPPFGLRALDVSRGETAAPWSEAAGIGLGRYHLTPDGSWMFFSYGDPGSYRIFRAPGAGGTAQLLVQAAALPFGVSDNGRFLAWSSGSQDSTFLQDLQTGSTRHLPGVRVAISVSTDGTLLLHQALEGVSLLQVGTGQTHALLPITGRRLYDYRWTVNDIELLVSGSGGTVEVLRGSGSAVTVYRSGSPLSPAAVGWSPDGRRLVVAYDCFFGNGCLNSLHIVDVVTGVSRLLTQSPSTFGAPRFSPAGDRIAVPSGGRLYIVPLP